MGNLPGLALNSPAFIIADRPGAALPVAAVTVLDRLVVSAHRAGFAPITVAGVEASIRFRRARALGIPWQMAAQLPAMPAGALLAAGNVLVTRADLARLRARGGRLIRGDGSGGALPVGIVPAVEAGTEETWSQPATVAAEGPVAVVTDPRTAAVAERALWASLTSPSDGLVDRWFNRPAGRGLVRLLIHTPVTPNQVSVVSVLVGLASAWIFAQGGTGAAVWGAILLQVSAMLDCVDGDIARLLFKETRAGKWIDLVGDQVVHIGVFAGIATGLGRAGSAAPVTALGVSAVCGVILSFGVVLWGLLSRAGRGNTRLQWLIDRAATRDFSVVLLGLALGRRLDWFLWLVAVGTHVFWLGAAAVLLRGRRRLASVGVPAG